MFSGISTHSKQGKYTIFSVFNKENSHGLNFELHQSMVRQLKSNNIPFKEVIGVYKKEEELSFIVQEKHIKSFSSLLLSVIFSQYKQESILLLANDKHGLYKAQLLFNTGNIENIGYFRQVAKEIALKQDSYTKDGNNYYICTESDATTKAELLKLGLAK